MKKIFGVLLTGVIVIGWVGCSTDNEKFSDISTTETVTEIYKSEPDMNNVDYSSNFGDFKGCGVFYNYSNNSYDVYNKKKCEKTIFTLFNF